MRPLLFIGPLIFGVLPSLADYRYPDDYTPPPILEDNHQQPEDFNGTIRPQHWYPWRKWHDKARIDRLDWSTAQQGVCLHTRPGFRKPSSLLGSTHYLGDKCSHFQKSGKSERSDVPEGRTAPPNLMCGPIEYSHVETSDDGGTAKIIEELNDLMGYLAVAGDYDSEICRAMCESCFDAMAEFGAEQAICRSTLDVFAPVTKRGHCGMGFVRFPYPPFACPTGRDSFPYRNTTHPACGDPFLTWETPRWWDLNYKDLEAAALSAYSRKGQRMAAAGPPGHNGDLRVYYAKGYAGTESDDWWQNEEGFRHGLASILQEDDDQKWFKPTKEMREQKEKLLKFNP